MIGVNLNLKKDDDPIIDKLLDNEFKEITYVTYNDEESALKLKNRNEKITIYQNGMRDFFNMLKKS